MTGALGRAPIGLALSPVAVERASARRGDEEWLGAAWADSRTRVLVIEDGRANVRFGSEDAELVFVSPDRAPPGVRFLLGEQDDGAACFGVAGPLPEPDGDSTVRRAGMRDAGPVLRDADSRLLLHAIGLANWHASAAHCPRCGALTEPVQAGHVRRCPADGSDHFPRTDPAVIMCVTDPSDRVLLARNASWPPGRVSVLAGFVEPGESAEDAVAREVFEETGITVVSVDYAASQPWPTPHSLMLGFRALTSETKITVDGTEIAEARWYSRADLAAAIEARELAFAPSISISRWLLETWYGTPLPASD